MNNQMKKSAIIFGWLASFTFCAYAMPTKVQLIEVGPLVNELMRKETAALKSGTKSRQEVAKSAMRLADEAESQAAKLLLMKGALNLYTRDEKFKEAINVLERINQTIPDIPPDETVSIIESSLRGIPRKKGELLYQVLDNAKLYARYINETEQLEKSIALKPLDEKLQINLAEHYAYLGKWDESLKSFAKTYGNAGNTAKGELDGTIALSEAANFWWDYPTCKSGELVRCFRFHAAKLYQKALIANDIKGLNKVLAERRIEEVKAYAKLADEKIVNKNTTTTPIANPVENKQQDTATTSKPEIENSKKYCVIDISNGSTSKSSITYMSEKPKGGWTADDKTKRIVLRKIKAGTDPLRRYSISKDYYISVFEITQKQWATVVGTNYTENKGQQSPKTKISVAAIRGVKGGKTIGKEGFAGKLESMTGLLGFDLPTEAQWEYAWRSGGLMKLDDVWERCRDNNNPLKGVNPIGDTSGKSVANCKWDKTKRKTKYAHSNLINPLGDRGFRIVLNLK